MNLEAMDAIMEESDNGLEAIFAMLMYAIVAMIFGIMEVVLGEVEEVTD